MRCSMANRVLIICRALAAFLTADACAAPPADIGRYTSMTRATSTERDAIDVWRITNDPTVRDHANYHNTQCWSPNGRYLCFTHYAANDREFGATSAAEVHLYDLHQEKDITVVQHQAFLNVFTDDEGNLIKQFWINL